MIYNITYDKKEIKDEINALIGKPYPWLERIRKRGIGSEKMQVIEASPMIEGLLQYDNQPNHCNIELRPQGVMVHFKYKAETYGWVIPYAKLSIYMSEQSYRIYGDADYIKVTKLLNGDALRGFMKKLLHERAVYLQLVAGPNQ